MQKWVTLEKLGHIWRNGSHSQKCVTFAIRGQTFKNRAVLQNYFTLEKKSHFQKQVNLTEMMHHTFKYAQKLKDWVTVAKLSDTRKNVSHLK